MEQVIAFNGPPEIMLLDQDSQFTSQAIAGMLKDHGIRHRHRWQRAWL